MAYIVGADRYQTRMVTTSLDDLISKDNSVRVIDSYVESLNLENLGFIEYSGRNRGQSPYRRSDLLKLHIYGYLNRIRSSRASVSYTHLCHLISKGVKGVYVGGSSGECIYQHVDERKKVLEAVMEEAKGKLTVIVHVGCKMCIRDSSCC